MTSEKERRRREKERAARQRACFNHELTHVRVGSWRSREGCSIRVVAASVWDLHGTVCTCCPKRQS